MLRVKMYLKRGRGVRLVQRQGGKVQGFNWRALDRDYVFLVNVVTADGLASILSRPHVLGS